MNKHDKEISSAEMTACWRALDTELSLDVKSILMSSDEGQAKAMDYQAHQYPAVTRHFCLRARYFFDQAMALLNSNNNYDAIISFGSGFSLLTRIIAEALHQQQPQKQITVIDSDIEAILLERDKRLSSLNLDKLAGIDFQNTVIDVDIIYQSNVPLSSLFSDNIKNPIFILEGLSYFLTTDCLQWLFASIKDAYPSAAIIWDYWPDDLPKRSRFFNSVLQYFKQSLPENVQAFISNELLDDLTKGFNADYFELAELEQQYVTDTKRHLLIDENDFIPARVITLTSK